MKCFYGCGQDAKYVLNNGKQCCSKSYNSCPKLKEKNSLSIKQGYKNGRSKEIPWFDGKRDWAKGLTKNNSTSISEMAKKNKESGKARYLRYKQGEKIPYFSWRDGGQKDVLAKQKQSKTMIQQYKNGRKILGGKGKISILNYDSKTYKFRSTFEFVFALFLVIKKIKFNYENIRVQYNNHTKINDFEIDGKLYEIRGIRFSNDMKEREEKRIAFETNGYKIRFIYSGTIELMKKYLQRRNIEIFDMIEKIKIGHKIKQYFVFNGDTLQEEKFGCVGQSVEPTDLRSVR
jgi:hypothetical protein